MGKERKKVLKTQGEMGLVVGACNPSTKDAKAADQEASTGTPCLKPNQPTKQTIKSIEYYLHDKVTGIYLEDLLVPLGIMALEFLNVCFFLDKRHWVRKVQEERMAGRCLGLWVGIAWPLPPSRSSCE